MTGRSKILRKFFKYLGGIIIWSAVCFNYWIDAIFKGFPKTKEDLLEMGYTEFDFMIRNIVCTATPIVWIAAPILFFVVCNYLKKRSENK